MIDEPDRAAAEGPEWRRSWRKRATVAVIAGIGAPLLWLLARTWRVRAVGVEHLANLGPTGDQPILALWHGRILGCMWHWRHRGIVVVTSENFDGEWIARIIQRFGFGAARGSSTRGGARALREVLRAVRQAPVGFTVDGPRGPRGIAQPGVVWLARATGHPIVGLHAEADRAWTVPSWDRTQIPKPFSRLVVSAAPALHVPADADDAALEAARVALEARLRQAEDLCRRTLTAGGEVR